MSEQIKKIIQEKKEKFESEIISIRRDLHAHPEIGFEELRTASIVAKNLKKLGLEVKTKIAKTGVTALLAGKFPGKTIMLRADMDALKLTELNEVSYKSTYDGKMHACGHDANTAWLIGSAMILSELKDELHGNVLFLFQPSEEGEGGALKMIEEGVLEDPIVDASISAHVWPNLTTGAIGVRYGTLMAATADFNILITGKGGHSSQPNRCIDPIRIGHQVYSSLQNIVYSHIDVFEPTVLTVTKFNAGTANNIIPNTLQMGGSVRSTTYETSEKMGQLMENTIKSIVEANHAEYSFEYHQFSPPLINDNKMTELIETVSKKLYGNDNIKRFKTPIMGGDDYSFFSQSVPSSYVLIGCRNESKGIVHEPHNPYFDVDEESLFPASVLLATSAFEFINNH